MTNSVPACTQTASAPIDRKYVAVELSPETCVPAREPTGGAEHSHLYQPAVGWLQPAGTPPSPAEWARGVTQIQQMGPARGARHRARYKLGGAGTGYRLAVSGSEPPGTRTRNPLIKRGQTGVFAYLRTRCHLGLYQRELSCGNQAHRAMCCLDCVTMGTSVVTL